MRFTEKDRTVELAHYSVKEYLQQIPDGSAFGTFRMDESLDQIDLGKSCLRYLLLKDYAFDPALSDAEHTALLN